MGFKTPEEVAKKHPRCTLAVAEGRDPVLQNLTEQGKYYVIEVFWEDGRTLGVIGYYPPGSCPIMGVLHPLPYRTQGLAETDAEKIREAQSIELQTRREEERDNSLCAVPTGLRTDHLWLDDV